MKHSLFFFKASNFILWRGWRRTSVPRQRGLALCLVLVEANGCLGPEVSWRAITYRDSVDREERAWDLMCVPKGLGFLQMGGWLMVVFIVLFLDKGRVGRSVVTEIGFALMNESRGWHCDTERKDSTCSIGIPYGCQLVSRLFHFQIQFSVMD